MPPGQFSSSNPPDGIADSFNAGQIVTPQALANLMATVDGVVGTASANSIYNAVRVCSLRSVYIDGTGAQPIDTTTAPTGSLSVSGTALVNGITTLKGGVSGTPVIKSSGTTPGVAAGAGAGASPTISIAGTDTCGIVTLSINNTAVVSSTLFTVTLASAFASAATLVVSLTPLGFAGGNFVGAAAIQCGGQTGGANPTGWFATTGTSAPGTGGPFKWFYQVSAF